MSKAFILFKVLTISIVISFCNLSGQVEFDQYNFPNTNTLTKFENYKRVEIHLQSSDDFAKVASLGIELGCGADLHSHGDHDALIIEISDAEYNSLVQEGLEVEVLIDNISEHYSARSIKDLPIAIKALKAQKQIAADNLKNAQVAQDMGCSETPLPVPQNFELGSMGGFITRQEMLDALDQMAAMYPNLITAKANASASGQTSLEGRILYYVKISDNPNVDETNEAEVLYTGLHHAREPLSMMNQIYYMWYLLENYNTDPMVKNIVDNTELYFLPMVNPDGYVYNESTNPNGGGMWRKNRRNNGNGTYGVDINRNYSFNWGLNNTGSSGATASETYRGTAPFSEPETQVIKEFTESREFVNAFHNHAYGNLLLHSWGYTSNDAPDHELLGEISEHMCWHNRYNYGGSNQTIYPTNGGAVDWFYGEQTTKNKILSWTPELGSSGEGGFWPSPSNILPIIQRQTRMSLILASSAANYGLLNDLTPYSLSGPNSELTFSVEHLSITPGSFDVTVSSSSPYVQNIANATLSTGTLTDADIQRVSTQITLDPNTPAGTSIDFEVTLNNGVYDIYNGTITKVYNHPTLFYDNGTDLSNWGSTGWGTVSSTGYNANGSITDSPTGNSVDGTRYLVMASPLDFSSIQYPVLEFYTQWDIRQLFDYAQLEVSTNGTTWNEICGNYSKNGVSSVDYLSIDPDQPQGVPIYDGYQKDWVREQIDLSAYSGYNSVYLRFKMAGDIEVNHQDGFYIDDISVYREPMGHCENGVMDADETAIDCGGADCIACPTCDDGIQNGTETGVDCGGSSCAICPPEYCPSLDFGAETIISYDAGQDFGPSSVQDGGATLYMENNAWKAIEVNYNVTPNTVLEFEFKSTIEGEIHEIGFDNDLIVGPDHRVVLYGFQGYAGTIAGGTYTGSGNFESFVIPVGTYFTGNYQYLVMTADHDANPANGNSYYRNVKIYEDVDGDLVCDNIVCVEGDACNDGNACTTNDAYDATCNCVGTFQDADNDGVCDTDDVCAGMDDALIGTSCDDGDACTTGDTYTINCACVGTFQDADNDGVCDSDDVCPNGDDTADADGDGTPDACDTCDGNLAGTSCDDNDACTTGETYDANCNCTGGVFQDADNDGVCNVDDVCAGMDDALIGTSCDDGDACTTGDVYTANCDCVGTFQDADNDGVCDANDICANGDDNADADNDGTPDACDTCDGNSAGLACDDGDACTTGETFDSNCNCTGGVFQDADNDGVCDASDICANGDDNADADNDSMPDACDACPNSATGDSDGDGVCDDADICPNGDDTADADGDGTPDACDTCDGNSVGMTCDDGNDCTTGETYDADCNCTGGVFQDADNDGVCDASDICANGDDNTDADNDGTPDACDTCPNSATGDSDGDGVCDDLDLCLNGDDNADADGDGTPDACDTCDSNLAGTTCNDGDACTTGETYDADCNCTGGVFQDADNDGVCDISDVCPVGDDNVDTDNDGAPDACDTCPNSATGDSDGDGVCDDEDICANGNDTADADGDGMPDACDICPTDAQDQCDILLDYCESSSSNTNYEYIENVNFAGINNTTEGSNGYDDQTDVVGTITAGMSYPVTLTPGFRSQTYVENWSVWIDFNQDGDFDDGNELVFTGQGNAAVSGDIDIPSNIEGTTRMRVSMAWNFSPIPCGFFNYGEVEDYTIVIEEGGTDPEPDPCTFMVINANDFEGGWGIWNDGGSDAALYSYAPFANSGTRYMQIRDNTNTSVVTTDPLNLVDFESLTVNFSYYARSMDNANEDFWLQLSTDGGSSFTTVEEWNKDDEFVNNQRYQSQVMIPGPFTSDTRLRFRCDASGNSDWVYIDDVIIAGCTESVLASLSPTTLVSYIMDGYPDGSSNGTGTGGGRLDNTETRENTDDCSNAAICNLIAAPSVTNGFTTIVFDSKYNLQAQMTLLDANGRVVEVQNIESVIGTNSKQLDLGYLNSGMYILTVQMRGEREFIRIIKQ